MSAGASTEGGREPSPLLRAAARGELPGWARMGPSRREHVARVVALLDEWARSLGLPEDERIRWRAAGWLHDALREAPAEELIPAVPPGLRDLPPLLLHGPAAAERIAAEAGESVANAVRYHTVGHPALDTLGKALFLADFLEPGRDFSREWRAELRERMPADLDAVLREVLGARIRHLLDERRPIRPETAAFWSSLVGSGPWSG
jgi:HD superfamily phosphohydrolase YqeK